MQNCQLSKHSFHVFLISIAENNIKFVTKLLLYIQNCVHFNKLLHLLVMSGISRSKVITVFMHSNVDVLSAKSYYVFSSLATEVYNRV